MVDQLPPKPKPTSSSPEAAPSTLTQEALAGLQEEVNKPGGLQAVFDKLALIIETITGKLEAALMSIPFFKNLLPAGQAETLSGKNRPSTMPSQGLNLAGANQFVAQCPPLKFMSTGRFQLDRLHQAALQFNKQPARPVSLNLNALQEAERFPFDNGRRCCAYYVSTILGISKKAGSTSGAFASVNQNLVPYLMRRNMDRNNGNPGIIFGYDNMRQGDVIVFRGTEDYAPDRYGHVGIVRDTFVSQGVEYLIMQHSSDCIYLEIIPVNPPSASTDSIQAIYNDPNQRQQIPALQSAYEYRRAYPGSVRFQPNHGYYGDASINRTQQHKRPPRAAFAIRTA